MKVLYSGIIDHSHSAFGGYHNIIRFPKCSKVLLSNNFFLGEVDKKYRLRKVPLGLLDIFTRLCRKKYDITHLFYGEITMLAFMPYSKDRIHKTVITLHLDIEKQRNHEVFVRNLKCFDGIIVLSTQQKEYYKSKYGIETTFIPHGFDKPNYEFHLPSDSKGCFFDKSKINLITSGKNYRDFKTLKKVAEYFNENDNIIFHLVGTPQNIKDQLKNLNNVRIYPRISDDDYYSLIESCDYGFLPVTFATANNALLECQSIGIKSILPRIPGILDYAAKENIFYNDVDDLINIISNIPKSSISSDILSHSERFHWDNIFKQLDNYYTNLLKNE